MGNFWDNDPVYTPPSPGQGAPPNSQPGTQSYYDGYARPAPNPADPSYGYSPSQAPPSDMDDQTKQAIGMDLMANHGAGVANILRTGPQVIYRQKYAEKAADSAQSLANLRDALGSYEGMIDQFRDVGTNAGPDVLPLAIGSDYTDREHPAAPDTGWLPTLSGMANTFARTKAALQAPEGKGLGILNGADTSSNAYVANNAALYGDPSSPNKYNKALDVNTRLQHLKEAVAMVYKSLPMGAQGGATDQAQQIVTNMIGTAMKAPDPNTFFGIIDDAKKAIGALKRQRVGAPEQPGQSFLPTSPAWAPPQAPGPQPSPQQAPPPQSAPAPSQSFDDPAMAARVPPGQSFTFRGHMLKALGGGQFQRLN